MRSTWSSHSKWSTNRSRRGWRCFKCEVERLGGCRFVGLSLRNHASRTWSSHELRTPLTAVMGFARVLEGGDSELPRTESTEMIRSIAEQSADLTNIVDDLLIAAKAEAGTLVVVGVLVDL